MLGREIVDVNGDVYPDYINIMCGGHSADF
jgi:hypothetical protein